MVGLAAGGITHVTARLYAEAASKVIGQRITVENKTGAGGGVAAAYVQNARARRLHAAGVLRLPARHRACGQQRDLRSGQGLFADHLSVQLRSWCSRCWRTARRRPWPRCTNWGRKKSGGLTFGTPGLGSPSHLLGAKILLADKVPSETAHYRGGPPMMADLITGRVDLAWPTLSTSRSFLAEEKLRALALDADTRWGPLPDVPTLVELGFANERVASWFALGGPAGMPPALVAKIRDIFIKASKDPELQRRLSRERHADRQQHARGDGARHGGGMGDHAGAGEDAELCASRDGRAGGRSAASGIIGVNNREDFAMAIVRRLLMAVVLAGLAPSRSAPPRSAPIRIVRSAGSCRIRRAAAPTSSPG